VLRFKLVNREMHFRRLIYCDNVYWIQPAQDGIKWLPYLTTMMNYRVTPWSRVVFKKLMIIQLVKKFLTFYGTRRSITVYKEAHPQSLF